MFCVYKSTLFISKLRNFKNRSNRIKYKRILEGKPHLHKYIMKCLDNQLTIMRTNLGFMQNLETWLNNHTWEKYEDIKNDDDEQRITRHL